MNTQDATLVEKLEYVTEVLGEIFDVDAYMRSYEVRADNKFVTELNVNFTLLEERGG